MTPIRLYSQKINPYAEKVARALHYKGLAHERIVSDDPQDVRRWSPVSRTLPVLEVDGRRTAESNPILAVIEERWPDPPLWSSEPTLAAQQRRFAEWSDTSFVYYWNRWRGARFPQPGDEQPAPRGPLSAIRRGIVRAVGGQSEQPSQADLREMQIMDELANRLDDVVGLLGDRPFFQSDQLSIADLSVFGMLEVMSNSPMTAGGALIQERPSLIAYMERVEALTRPPRDDEADQPS